MKKGKTKGVKIKGKQKGQKKSKGASGLKNKGKVKLKFQGNTELEQNNVETTES